MTTLVAKALRLKTTDTDFEAAFQKRLHWSADADAAIESRVAEILTDVQQRGDLAVLDYTPRSARTPSAIVSQPTCWRVVPN